MYEPKIEVVRKMGANSWYLDDGRYRSSERAYLVRGLPMPGEKVRHTSGAVGVVVGLGQLTGAWPSMHVRDEDGDAWWALVDIRPHDPEAERLRVATEAVLDARLRHNGLIGNEDIARAVLDAIKEVDDG